MTIFVGKDIVKSLDEFENGCIPSVYLTSLIF